MVPKKGWEERKLQCWSGPWGMDGAGRGLGRNWGAQALGQCQSRDVEQGLEQGCGVAAA